jgi:hypothetical protein
MGKPEKGIPKKGSAKVLEVECARQIQAEAKMNGGEKYEDKGQGQT